MAQGFVLNGGNYNVLTLQPQPAALAVTTGPGSIRVQVTPPPAAFLEPEVEYWVTHKPGGIPEHPFDGAYQKMATGGGRTAL